MKQPSKATRILLGYLGVMAGSMIVGFLTYLALREGG